MREMDNKTLQEYLHNAILLETDIATQEHIRNSYNTNAENRMPQLNLRPLPEKPKLTYTSTADKGFSAFVAGCFLLFFSFGGLIWGMNSLMLIFLIAGIGLVLPYINMKNNDKKANKKEESDYADALEYYKNKCAIIEKNNNLGKQQHSRNLDEWSQNNKHNLALIDSNLNESKKALEKLYSLDVIYPKYRNLPALTRIYEYFVAERCESLTGPHGAYNLYEDEVRKDMIISQLSVVIEKLEQIKQNQYMLYQQVKEIQKTANSIESELRQIKGYTVQLVSLTALNNYYAALTERNTRITMWCNI